MRPYLAVIRDSFHEAFASRVLWILLVLTALFLLLLAPLGVTEQPASRLATGDLRQGATLLRTIAGQADAEEASPGKHLFAKLSGELRQALAASLPGDVDRRRVDRQLGQRLLVELNDLLPRRDLYLADAWRGVELSEEARELRDEGLDGLDEARIARFNRLALEAAFPSHIAPSGRSQLQWSYLAWNLGVAVPVGRDDLKPLINGTLRVVMGLVLGVGGVLVAILVTASIIPQAFEAGAIDLLLSKPVSRSLIFLSRFLGGCAFILILSALLISGLWLILGTRFGIWNARLLWCIPLYLFLFAIYFSVSAVSGLVWRNAIVAVVMTILFWAVCFSLGITRNFVEGLFLNPLRVNKVIAAGDDLFSVTETNEIKHWNAANREWKDVFAPPGGGPPAPLGLRFQMPLIGPIADATGQRLLAADRAFPRGGFGNISPNLWVGRADEDWARAPGALLPPGVEALGIATDGSILAVTPAGVFRCQGDPEKPVETMEMFGIEVVVEDSGGVFMPASTELELRSPLSVAFDAKAGGITLFDGGRLVSLTAGDDGQFQVVKQIDLDERQSGLIARAGDKVALALADGTIGFYDATELRQTGTWQPDTKIAPRLVTVSPDGRWLAVVFHERLMKVFDLATREELSVGWPGQGDISAAAFTPDGQLLVVDHLNRVTMYQAESWDEQRRDQPQMGGWETAYRLAINPLYTVFPKPGELNELVTWILSDEATVGVPLGDGNLSDARQKIDVAGPIWSNLAFLSIVLAVGCLYVARKDF
jgi:hypothetical protein